MIRPKDDNLTQGAAARDSGEGAMGKTTVDIDVINTVDVVEGKRASQWRRVQVNFIVDTGATLVSLPIDLIERLGLKAIAREKVKTSVGIVEKRKFSPVRIEIMGRQGDFNVMELPVGTPALLGCVPLETLDLVVNPRKNRLEGNPEHDGEYIIESL